MRILAIALCVFLVFGAGSPSVAESEHDRARAAVRDGRSLPLYVILNQARARVPGRVLGVNLRGGKGGGRPLFYDIKMLTPSGEVVRVRIDARTAAVRGVRGAGRRNRFRRPPGPSGRRFVPPGQRGRRFGGRPPRRGPFARHRPPGPGPRGWTFRRGPRRGVRRGGGGGWGWFGGRGFRRGGGFGRRRR